MGRNKTVIDVDWVYAKKEVTQDNIDETFEFLLNRRDIRQTNVNKLSTLLFNGEHFETPLVINEVKGKYRLIDGNHRVEAIKKFLKTCPDKKVIVGLCKYENLSSDEEREMFTKWNLAAKQSTTDFLKAYWDTIPTVKKFEKPSFPVNVSYTWQGEKMDVKCLVSAYLGRFANKNPRWTGDAMSFVETMRNLDKNDVNTLREFMNEFISIFGKPDKRSYYYYPAIFQAIQRIWLDNKERFSPDKLQVRLKKLINHERVLYWYKLGAARGVLRNVIKDFLDVLNAQCSIERNLFVFKTYKFQSDTKRHVEVKGVVDDGNRVGVES